MAFDKGLEYEQAIITGTEKPTVIESLLKKLQISKKTAVIESLL